MTLKDLIIEIEQNEFSDMIFGYYLNSLLEEFFLNENLILEGEIKDACALKDGRPGFADSIGTTKIADILSKILKDKNYEESLSLKLNNYRACIRALMNKFSKELGIHYKIPEDNTNQQNIKKALEKYKAKIFNKIKQSVNNTTQTLIKSISNKNSLDVKNVINILTKYEQGLLNFFKKTLDEINFV
jgi:hypothetical protein